jgi:hypothetical protein
MKASRLDFSYIWDCSQLCISPDQYRLSGYASAFTELFQAVEEVIYSVPHGSVAAIEVFIYDLADLTSNEGHAQLITEATTLSTEVSFASQLKVARACDYSPLVYIYCKHSMTIGQYHPSLTSAGARVAAQQVEVKLAPLIEMIRLKCPQEAVDH